MPTLEEFPAIPQFVAGTVSIKVTKDFADRLSRTHCPYLCGLMLQDASGGRLRLLSVGHDADGQYSIKVQRHDERIYLENTDA